MMVSDKTRYVVIFVSDGPDEPVGAETGAMLFDYEADALEEYEKRLAEPYVIFVSMTLSAGNKLVKHNYKVVR